MYGMNHRPRRVSGCVTRAAIAEVPINISHLLRLNKQILEFLSLKDINFFPRSSIILIKLEALMMWWMKKGHVEFHTRYDHSLFVCKLNARSTREHTVTRLGRFSRLYVHLGVRSVISILV